MAEDNAKEAAPKTPCPNPVEEMEKKFTNFLFVLYYTNPLKNSVRVSLDDGSIKMWMSRGKFLKLMEDILNDTLLWECQQILYKVKVSLNSYGKFYWYNRANNDFKELSEGHDYDKIRPQDLFSESRKELQKENKRETFNQVKNDYQENVLDNVRFVDSSRKTFNKLFSIIRGDIKNKKKTPLS